MQGAQSNFMKLQLPSGQQHKGHGTLQCVRKCLKSKFLIGTKIVFFREIA